METTATKTSDGWVLNGSKTWISNAPVADLFVIWARVVENGEKGKVRGFLVEKGTPGLSAPAIKNKMSLRASITGSIFMEDVKLSDDALLPKSNGLGSPFSCLNNARYGISWGVMGALEDCIARARDYALERQVFFMLSKGRRIVTEYLHRAETSSRDLLHLSSSFKRSLLMPPRLLPSAFSALSSSADSRTKENGHPIWSP